MSRSRAHDWNKERVILDRRGSDGEYDIRSPGDSHRNARPQPSYYGPNFSDVEKRRSSSLAYGDIRHPVTPDRYGKRPQPYPPHVAKEYDEYKKYDKLYAKAKAKTADNKTLLKTPVHDDKYRQNIEMARDLAHGSRVAANTASAVRTGFAHKYPYAYDGLRGTQGHERAIETLQKGAKNAAKAERSASRLLARR
ncbi:uncharacterized protein CDV56_107801 [Aspergillus thermomutatus]|uniref:Uncharacterized protein n=1 Tax=Aspergillus thermomutatus TaxID=41047 RepID=A0A397H4R4_ASPTH|nr:uncharacterized protein CDV56_107801 [Aspergillus thermomutatus]RHZ58017.1 hypothetical protein CDV56_107801 [Aspergillus thermomutatus]